MALLKLDGGAALVILFLALGAVVLAVYLLRVILGTHKIVDIYEKIEKIENEMICPLCLGKGFVDNHDIVRYNKLNYWNPGFCKFCDAKGKVTKGITKTTNPMEINQ
jgi:hypothetical protein